MRTRYCKKCEMEKPLAAFPQPKQLYAKVPPICTPCRNAPKTRVVRNNKRNIEETIKYLQVLRSAGCSKCEEKDPRCMDFHHTNPATKLFELSKYTKHTFEEVKAEAAKCIVLCNNCHKVLHHEEMLQMRGRTTATTIW